MDKITEWQNNHGKYNYNHYRNIYVLFHYHGDRDHDEYIYDSDGESMNMSFMIKRFNKHLVRVKSTLIQNKYNGNCAATSNIYFYCEFDTTQCTLATFLFNNPKKNDNLDLTSLNTCILLNY